MAFISELVFIFHSAQLRHFLYRKYIIFTSLNIRIEQMSEVSKWSLKISSDFVPHTFMMIYISFIYYLFFEGHDKFTNTNFQ